MPGWHKAFAWTFGAYYEDKVSASMSGAQQANPLKSITSHGLAHPFEIMHCVPLILHHVPFHRDHILVATSE
jgi:hypothetical protein